MSDLSTYKALCMQEDDLRRRLTKAEADRDRLRKALEAIDETDDLGAIRHITRTSLRGHKP